MVQLINEIWCKDCSNPASWDSSGDSDIGNKKNDFKKLHITAVTDIPPSNSKNISFVNMLSELPDVEYTRLGDLGKTLTYANSFLHIPPQDNPIYAPPSNLSLNSLTNGPTTSPLGSHTPTPTTTNFREESPPVNNIQLQVPTIQFSMDDSARSKPKHMSETADFCYTDNDNHSESKDSDDGDESEDLSDDDGDESEAQSMESLTTENAKLKLSKTLSSMSFISRTTTSASQAHTQGMNMSVYGTQEYPQPLKTSMSIGSLGGSFSSGYKNVQGFNDPADYYKSSEYTRNLELAEYYCILNGGSDSLQQSKFSNLTEVEDLQNKKKDKNKDKDQGKNSKDEQNKKEDIKEKDQHTPSHQYRKPKSQISGLLGNKNIKDLTNEELALVEEQLGKSTKSKTGSNMDNYEFNMKQKLIFDDPVLKNGSTASSFMKRMDMKKKKLLLQNGYPTRPWIRSKSIILTKQHPEYDKYVSTSFSDVSVEQKPGCFRNVFIYISNREHTWTSIECYFKYFARDGDHLIIGTRIPEEMMDPYSIIFRKTKKPTTTTTASANAKLSYYEDLEQRCEDACEDVLKYIYYKTFFHNKKIKFTINMSKSGDLKNCIETFLREYDPHLILITSISFNLFIKFSNSHIKLSRLFTRFLRFCIVINQDFFDMERPKNFKSIKDPVSVIDQCILDSFNNPFDSRKDETEILKSHNDVLNQEFFQKYGYYKPSMISIDDCELDSYTDYSYYNFIKYLNKRRKNTRLIGYYDANLQVLKPASYYLNNFNKRAIAQKKPDHFSTSTTTPSMQFPGMKRGSVSSIKSNATVAGWNTLTATKSGGSYHYRNNSTGSYGNTSDGANSLGGANNTIDGNIQKIKSLTGDNAAVPGINDKFTIVSNTQADMKHFKRQKKLLEQQKLQKLNSKTDPTIGKSSSSLEKQPASDQEQQQQQQQQHHHHHHHHLHLQPHEASNERPTLSLNSWSWKSATGSTSNKKQDQKNMESVNPNQAEKVTTNSSTNEHNKTSEESKPKPKKKDKKWKFW